MLVSTWKWKRRIPISMPPRVLSDSAKMAYTLVVSWIVVLLRECIYSCVRVHKLTIIVFSRRQPNPTISICSLPPNLIVVELSRKLVLICLSNSILYYQQITSTKDPPRIRSVLLVGKLLSKQSNFAPSWCVGFCPKHGNDAEKQSLQNDQSFIGTFITRSLYYDILFHTTPSVAAYKNLWKFTMFNFNGK